MLDARDLAQRNLRAVAATRPAPGRAPRGSARYSRRVPHAHRKPPAAFDRRRQHGLADRRFDDLLDVADADAVPRRGGAIDLDVEVLAARDLLGIDVARAGHLPHDVRRRVARHLRATSRSVPNTFTPTSDRMPVVSMSIRLMIGIVQMFETPGI